MKNEVIARPYARALFSLARDGAKEELIAQQLGQVVTIWDGETNFRQFIRRPEVTKTAKKDLVKRVFGDLDRVTERFLDIVIDKNREEMLSAIYEEYRNLWDQSRGIMHAEVTTAVPLTDDQEKSLANALGQATGHTVEVTLKRDRSLMGGIVVRMGDRVLDGSLARRLAVLGDRLRSGDGGGSVVEH